MYIGPLSLSGSTSETASSADGYRPGFLGGQGADYVRDIEAKLRAAYPGIEGFTEFSNQPGAGNIPGTATPQVPTTNALGFRYNGPALFTGQAPSTVDALLANAPLPTGAAASGSGGAGPSSLGVPVAATGAGSGTGTGLTGRSCSRLRPPFAREWVALR